MLFFIRKQMDEQLLSPQEKLFIECAEIHETIQGIFELLSRALEHVEDGRVILNIKREQELIQALVSASDDTIEEVNEYTKMRLEALPPMARGLLNYARKKETTKVKDSDRIASVMLKPSTIMEVKGSLRRLARLHTGSPIKIEMVGAEVPKEIFKDNNFYLDDRSQYEVLMGKRLNQPRVFYSVLENGTLISPEIKISNGEELQSILDGHFFDDYAALGLQKRMTIIVS